jgi:DNA processing protein
MEESLCGIRLSLALGAGSVYTRIADGFGGAENLFRASDGELTEAGFSAATLRRIRNADSSRAAEIAEFCAKAGVSLVFFGSEDYPAPLSEIADPPYLLYVAGRIPDLSSRLGAGIVGTRRMTRYGMETAFSTAYLLSSAGAVTVSGMARGIDAVAACGTLEAKGETVAVLGCGPDRAYPPEHAHLMREISQTGAVVSEYPPGTPPSAWNFPMRNRIISGLSRVLFVVEAGEKSGAILTANCAKEQGRTVFALPGRATDETSAGTVRLLCEGARAAAGAGEIVEYCASEYPGMLDTDAFARACPGCGMRPGALSAHGITGADESRGIPVRKAPEEKAPSATGEEEREKKLPEDVRLRDFYLKIPVGEPVCADFFPQFGYRVNEALNLLSVLEISGYLKSVPGGMYKRID